MTLAKWLTFQVLVSILMHPYSNTSFYWHLFISTFIYSNTSLFQQFCIWTICSCCTPKLFYFEKTNMKNIYFVTDSNWNLCHLFFSKQKGKFSHHVQNKDCWLLLFWACFNESRIKAIKQTKTVKQWNNSLMTSMSGLSFSWQKICLFHYNNNETINCDNK